MRKQLSRLEREYVLSCFSDSPVPLEIKNRASSVNVVCPPSFYKYDRVGQRISFKDEFLSGNKIPDEVSCEFQFSYRERKIAFSAEISGGAGGTKFCPVGSLFYVEEGAGAGNRVFSVEAEIRTGSAVFSAVSSPEFPLNTDKLDVRIAAFMKTFPRRKHFSGDYGLLLYIDHRCAVFTMPLKAPREISPFPVLENGREYNADFSVRFEKRKIILSGVLSSVSVGGASSADIRICRMNFIRIVPEDERFLFELSRGKKYTGPSL